MVGPNESIWFIASDPEIKKDWVRELKSLTTKLNERLRAIDGKEISQNFLNFFLKLI